MTGKQVQLPWGRATVEEEATIAAAASERDRARRRPPAAAPTASSCCASSTAPRGARRAGRSRCGLPRSRRWRSRCASSPSCGSSWPGSANDQSARRSRASPASRAAAISASSASSAHRARSRSPASRALESTGKSSPATRCQVPMPPRAAAANGPACSQRRALPKRTTSSDRLRRGDAVVDDPQCLAQQCVLQAVPDEAGDVSLHEHRSLAAAGDRSRASATASGRLCGPRDHLHQRHQQRRIPVVRADGALRRAAGLADVTDRERRGIAGDDRIGEVRRDRREHLALEHEVLGHRLDDELAALDPAEGIAGAERDAAACGRGLVVQTEPHAPWRAPRRPVRGQRRDGAPGSARDCPPSAYSAAICEPISPAPTTTTSISGDHRPMRIVITGGLGMLGTELARRLRAPGRRRAAPARRARRRCAARRPRRRPRASRRHSRRGAAAHGARQPRGRGRSPRLDRERRRRARLRPRARRQPRRRPRTRAGVPGAPAAHRASCSRARSRPSAASSPSAPSTTARGRRL